MIADVPVGAFLSGGIDSNAVVADMKNFKSTDSLYTFSVCFDGETDESHFIRIAQETLQTVNKMTYFNEQNFEDLIDKYVYSFDEPFVDLAGFPTIELSKIARKTVTVALTGDGGDEILGVTTPILMNTGLCFFGRYPSN